MALGWRGQYLRYREFFLNVVALYRQRVDLRAFLEIALSLSTIAIFTLFALKPTALTIIALAKEIGEKKDTLAALDQKVTNLQTASNIFSQNENEIADVDTAVSTSPKPDAIAKQIQGLAAKNSVTLLGLSVGQVTLVGKDTSAKQAGEFQTLPENAREMPLSVSLRGDYPALVGFLADFENLRIAHKIDILRISSSAAESGRIIVVAITARIPYLGE